MFGARKGAVGLLTRIPNDPDAQIAIDALYAAGLALTDPEQDAVNNLFLGFKTNGTFTKRQVIYLFMGTNSATHSINAKMPGVFNITWTGGITFTTQGAQGDGTTGSGSTGYIPSTHATLNDSHIQIYCRSILTSGLRVEMGCFSSAPIQYSVWEMRTFYNNFNMFEALMASEIFIDAPKIDPGGTQGLFTITRNSAASASGYKNGNLLISGNQQHTQMPNHTMRLFASTSPDTGLPGTVERFSNAQLAFASIGRGFTAAEVAADYTVIQAFQTKLQRAV